MCFTAARGSSTGRSPVPRPETFSLRPVACCTCPRGSPAGLVAGKAALRGGGETFQRSKEADATLDPAFDPVAARFLPVGLLPWNHRAERRDVHGLSRRGLVGGELARAGKRPNLRILVEQGRTPKGCG